MGEKSKLVVQGSWSLSNNQGPVIFRAKIIQEKIIQGRIPPPVMERIGTPTAVMMVNCTLVR